ncbi:MAG TPA: hypothetical protein VG674_18130 [Amycolatopsis sp.]|nr:hypothetical protein [Amycolatopsis sp.]
MTAPAGTRVAVENFVRFLETGTVPDDLFAPDVFADLSLPQWRVQTATAGDLVALRADSHPYPGRVRIERQSTTECGFTLEFEERWTHEGRRWYCREMIRADVEGDRITELSIYCTGDWDETTQRDHAAAVRLLRP